MTMSLGVHDIPRKFSGENRYLKVLTGKATKYLCIGGVLWLFLFKFCRGLGFPKIGFLTGMFITLILVLVGSIKVPERLYLYSGGVEIDIIIMNVIHRKTKKVIYTSYMEKRR